MRKLDRYEFANGNWTKTKKPNSKKNNNKQTIKKNNPKAENEYVGTLLPTQCIIDA